MYKSIENDPAVRQAHRDYLFMRDYTDLCAVFIGLYGAAALFTIQSMRVRLTYLVVLTAQFVLVRQAACSYGIRFVTTVLARKAGKEVPAESRKTTGAEAQAGCCE